MSLCYDINTLKNIQLLFQTSPHTNRRDDKKNWL